MSKKTKARDMGFRLATGVVAGAAATWAMKQVTSLLESKTGIPPREEQGEDQKEPSGKVLVDRASSTFGFNLSPEQHHQADQAMKWLLGAGGGAATAWVRKKTDAGHSFWRGALLGLGSFILFEEILKPAIGSRQKPTDIPLKAHVRDLAGHTTYGLVNTGVRKAASRFLPV